MDDIKLGQPRIIEYIRHSIPWTVYDTVWVPLSTRFVAMGSYPRGTGAIQVFQLKEGKIALLHEYKKKTTIKCGTFSHSTIENRTLATGDFEGNLSVYDIEDEANPIYRVEKAHESIINTIDGAGSTFGPPEIVTGSRDGCVKIWDIRQKDKPVASLEPDVNETQADCWAVAFGNSYDDHERGLNFFNSFLI
jgi:WD40 repeat protein